MRAVPTLQTQRLTLRPLQRSDAAALFPTLSDPEQCRYLTRPEFETEEDLWGWLADPEWQGRTWIAQDASGDVAVRLIAVPGHAAGVEEVGYITCAHRQGEGLASEGMRALADYLFGQSAEQGGARKLVAEVDTRNFASSRILEKLGFTREAHFREHEATHVGMCDVYWYGLLKSEWKAAA